MEGKNSVKCAYQQTVENRLKSAPKKDLLMAFENLSTNFCEEIKVH